MRMKVWLIWTLTLALILGVTGCAKEVPQGDNARWDGERKQGEEYVAEGEVAERQPIAYAFDASSDPFAAAYMALSVELFRGAVANNDYDANTLISPLSVSMALAMMANGAEGETREQMLALFGEGMTLERLNEAMGDFAMRAEANAAPILGEGSSPTVDIANSLWLRESEGVTFRDEFSEALVSGYEAEAFLRPFDEDTVREINRWVKKQTDGMIPSVLDGLREQDVMVLVNTLLFEARWDEPFTERQLKSGTFTAADGSERAVTMMSDTEYYYLDDGAAQGFWKYYSGGEYAFVALLPDVGSSVADYVSGMQWETILAMLRDRQAAEGIWCRYQIPKFSLSYNDGGRLDAVLQALGMTNAYDEARADFGGVGEMAGDNNIYLDSVVHKTAMTVDENGTSAAAVTALIAPGSPMPIEIREVVFDRPFVCMIVEVDTGMPLFMASVMDIGQ